MGKGVAKRWELLGQGVIKKEIDHIYFSKFYDRGYTLAQPFMGQG